MKKSSSKGWFGTCERPDLPISFCLPWGNDSVARSAMKPDPKPKGKKIESLLTTTLLASMILDPLKTKPRRKLRNRRSETDL